MLLNVAIEQTAAAVSQPAIGRVILSSWADGSSSVVRHSMMPAGSAGTDEPLSSTMPEPVRRTGGSWDSVAANATGAKAEPADKELPARADDCAQSSPICSSIADMHLSSASSARGTVNQNAALPDSSARERDGRPIAPAAEPGSGREPVRKQVEAIASGGHIGEIAFSTPVNDGSAVSKGEPTQQIPSFVPRVAERPQTGATRQTPMTLAAPRMTGAGLPVLPPRSESVDPVIIAQARTREPEIAMRLTLAHLGTVEVRIANADDTSAVVRISTDRAQTLHTMLADQSQLHAVLQQSGVGREGRTIEYGLLADSAPDGAPDRDGRRRDDEAVSPVASIGDDKWETDLASSFDLSDVARSFGAVDITA